MKTPPVVGFLFAVGCTQGTTSPSSPDPGGGKADGPGGAVQTLRCTSGFSDEFRATLDASGFEPGSGYFDVRDARIRDNYAAAELICTGHTLGEIDCIGFWFDIGDEIGEVKTTSDGTTLTAAYAPLKGDLVHMRTPPWSCTVK
jgi:hypothetical protein